MKKYLLIVTAILSISGIAFAQELTDEPNKPRQMMTLTGPDHTGGGYGAFTTGYSEIKGRNAFEFGFRGMWVINHSIAMGFGGTGFANQAMYNSTSGSDSFITGGYGGFIIEPIVAPMYPVHIAFPILIGGGGISYVETDWDEFDNFVLGTDFFMLIQPGAEIELNVTRFFRIGLGASYRFPTDFNSTTTETPEMSPQDLKGFSYALSFKFGRF
ncbi:MAG: hypothetical protein MUC78_11355 [Bacteroidales bacterium]|jgi:hypothetical protein|nr:hypothetical protein [Bacteroidales bacterium]